MTNDRVTPVPAAERSGELTLPGGRGSENHGIPQTGHPDDPIDYTLEGVPVVFETPTPPPPPQPVYIVSDDRVLRDFRTGRAYADGTPRQIMGQFTARQTARITNLSTVATDRVWVGPDQNSATPQSGYPLDPGKELTLTAETEVYVIADPGSATVAGGGMISLAMWQDYRVDIH